MDEKETTVNQQNIESTGGAAADAPRAPRGGAIGAFGVPGDGVTPTGKRMAQKPKRRVCSYCMNKVDYIDYKDINRLKKYISEKGKIIPRRQTGLCARHQRELTTAVKRAQNMSLI